MRVLILTKIFPNSVEPVSSPFNRQQFGELGKLCDVEILATIPWFPGARAFAKWSRAGRLLDVPQEEEIDGMVVKHPRFVFLPRFGHGLSGPLYAASLAGVAMKYRGKVDVVLGSWAYPDGYAAVVLAQLLQVPAVVKLHGSDINVVAQLPGPRRALEWALPEAERVVAVSAPLRDAAVELGVPRRRVDLVPNGIDRIRFRPRDRARARGALGLPEGGNVVLYVGNIERHKGSLDLIRAFAALARWRPEALLVMVGGGSAEQDCKRLAEQLGARVQFVGPKPHDDIPEWIAASDVLALPSLNEGTPNVVIEALACGRRVVATRVGGTPDVVTSDALGVLVPPGDPPSLAVALETALGRVYDPELVSAELQALDWAGSARLLHESLLLALESRARRAA